MNTVVVDSSVIVKWINQTKEENIDKADQILQNALDGRVELVAPELAKYEVGNVLMKKKLTVPEAAISLGTVYSLPVNFISALWNETALFTSASISQLFPRLCMTALKMSYMVVCIRGLKSISILHAVFLNAVRAVVLLRAIRKKDICIITARMARTSVRSTRNICALG